MVASDNSRGNDCCAGGSGGGGYLGELWRLGLAAAIRVTRAAHLQILQLLHATTSRPVGIQANLSPQLRCLLHEPFQLISPGAILSFQALRQQLQAALLRLTAVGLIS